MSNTPIPALTTAQMQEVDRLMVEEYHIELLQMMENAGRNLAVLATRLLDDDVADRPIVVLAGRGNNGGGGLVAARHLLNWGAWVQVVTSYAPDGYKGVVGTYDLPPGVYSLGNEPQPINRDFRLLNTTGVYVAVTLDLECVGVRTGPALDEDVTITNSASVTSATYDPDPSNNDASASLVATISAGTGDQVVPVPSSLQVAPSGAQASVTVRCGAGGSCTSPRAVSISSASFATRRSTRPSCSARSARIVRPVSIRSSAGRAPSRRTLRTVPPNPGWMPSWTSGRPSASRSSPMATR